MLFTLRLKAIERLGLSLELKDQEFDGPPIEDGLLAGYTGLECRVARKLVNAKDTQGIDLMDARVLYHWLAIRREDPTLIPTARFLELSLADFEVVAHVPDGDAEEGCVICGRAFTASMHLGENPGE